MEHIGAKLVDVLQSRKCTRIGGKQDSQIVNATLNARPYLGLHRDSLALAAINTDSKNIESVNIVFPKIDSSSAFAGVMTGLELACQVAKNTNRKVQVIALSNVANKRLLSDFSIFMEKHFPSDFNLFQLVTRDALPRLQAGPNDVWIATYWTTALALDVACNLELIARRRVVYLVQDFEPDFFPASTESALAYSTYSMGFKLVINSTPLANFLKNREGIDFDPDLVFAPELDYSRLSNAAALRTSSSELRIAFYGRPSKPRNMFDLGIAALRIAATELDEQAIKYSVVSIGEKHESVRLSNQTLMKSVGKLKWHDYFNFLASTDLLLSLQATPHPSHPPLDMIAAGGIAITNEVGDSRKGIHPRLRAVSASPKALASGILNAATAAPTGSPSLPLSLLKLGSTLSVVAVRIIDKMAL